MSEEVNVPTATEVELPKVAVPTVKVNTPRPATFVAPVEEKKTSALAVLLDAVSAAVAIAFAVLVYMDNGFKWF